MKYPHSDTASKGDGASTLCDGEMLPAQSIDPAYDRWECEKCHAGISRRKGATQ